MTGAFKLLLGGSAVTATAAAGAGLDSLGGSQSPKAPKDTIVKTMKVTTVPSCEVFLVESEGKRKASVMGNLKALKESDPSNGELWTSLGEVCKNLADKKVYVGNIGTPKKLTHQTRYQSMAWTIVPKSSS
ncbi:hypothetical protein HF1_05910 [Mycoplasma haemofelis str. Langford 1]|uniref:Uncharacterized protein n=1 Tax=Mycoplasma haemofelis (strain Langford 1) TaxID=941640 RepID=E8ZHH8_MYCHL|nr:hypothetical protein [Mycoplasma haemofelis]CBY92599.1 hypothetical protein HF1_05910 [Mycoplasma haemofelis str. Langford 1]